MRLAAIALVLVAAGCGASSKSQVASGGPVAFSRCLRANGVTRFPDPAGDGTIPKVSLQRLGVSGSQLQSAQNACRHLLPNAGRPPSTAQQQAVREASVEFSHCVRRHGVPNFPDPGSDGRIPDPATVGVDQGSPQFEAANDACARYRPPYMPSNAAYNAYARTHG